MKIDFEGVREIFPHLAIACSFLEEWCKDHPETTQITAKDLASMTFDRERSIELVVLINILAQYHRVTRKYSVRFGDRQVEMVWDRLEDIPEEITGDVAGFRRDSELVQIYQENFVERKPSELSRFSRLQNWFRGFRRSKKS